MPDSVEMPAPLSTATEPLAKISSTSSRSPEGASAPPFGQSSIGRVRMNAAYVAFGERGP
jgi:hypothetical protein